MDTKEPWLAVNLSALLPGIGQIYGGQRLRGLLWLASFLLLAMVGVLCVVLPSQSASLGFALLLFAGLLQFINLFDAFRTVRRSNPNEFEYDRSRQKDPWKAFFLSSIVLGIGYAYAGHWGALLGAWLALVVVLVILGFSEPMGVLLLIGLTTFCAYDAYKLLVHRRPQMAQVWLLPMCLAVIAFKALSGLPDLALEMRYVSSESMSPTLQFEDRVLINTFYRVPKRGDVVTFYLPDEAMPQATIKDVFIKRVVGLPGETLEVKEGQVIVNNQPLSEAYVKSPVTYAWGPQTVPEDQYFVLGDNRNNSFDSHVFGFVPRENIVGHATKIYWPLNRSAAIGT